MGQDGSNVRDLSPGWTIKSLLGFSTPSVTTQQVQHPKNTTRTQMDTLPWLYAANLPAFGRSGRGRRVRLNNGATGRKERPFSLATARHPGPSPHYYRCRRWRPGSVQQDKMVDEPRFSALCRTSSDQSKWLSKEQSLVSQHFSFWSPAIYATCVRGVVRFSCALSSLRLTEQKVEREHQDPPTGIYRWVTRRRQTGQQKRKSTRATLVGQMRHGELAVPDCPRTTAPCHHLVARGSRSVPLFFCHCTAFGWLVGRSLPPLSYRVCCFALMFFLRSSSSLSFPFLLYCLPFFFLPYLVSRSTSACCSTSTGIPPKSYASTRNAFLSLLWLSHYLQRHMNERT
ncbi:hypothetical protein HDK77DRAFT_202633 [Phyllosticta capitalensis]